MRANVLILCVVNLLFTGTASAQRLFAVSSAATPIIDLGATINASIALLPVIDGHKAGVITIPPGIYTQSTTIHVNSPGVSIIGAGSGAVQITCTMNSVCWDIRIIPFATNPSAVGGGITLVRGGQFSGFTLIGQSGNTNAVGIHMGDITDSKLEDIFIEGFTGTNAVGLWWDNINGWTERINVQRLNLDSNTTNFKFTVAGSAFSSFCYNQLLDIRMNVNANQKGIDFQSGWLCGSTLMMMVNGFGANKNYINIAGTSSWHDNLYDIKVEDDSGDGGLILATAPGTEFNGTGRITNIAGPMKYSIEGSFALFLPSVWGNAYSSTTGPAQWSLDKFGDLQVQEALPASASGNVNSPLVALKANCWNGSATGVDSWGFQNVLDPGANPGSILRFVFSPYSCTAVPEVQVADGIGNGILLSTSAPGVAPRIRHDANDNVIIDTGGPSAGLYLNTDNNKPVNLGMGQTSGANIPILASLTTGFGTNTNVSMPGVTNASHCSLTATDAVAAANISHTFVSAKTEGRVTIAHPFVPGMTYDILCTPN